MKVIECNCRKLCLEAIKYELPIVFQVCKKCFNKFRKKRDKFLKEYIDNKSLVSSVNYTIKEHH
jgi:hypothetical protein